MKGKWWKIVLFFQCDLKTEITPGRIFNLYGIFSTLHVNLNNQENERPKIFSIYFFLRACKKVCLFVCLFVCMPIGYEL